MDKIIDGMLYTMGSGVIILPIFYFGSLQLIKFKKDIVATSMDQFTNNLFGNIFRPPVAPGLITPLYEKKKDPDLQEQPTEITSFFLKKRGVH